MPQECGEAERRNQAARQSGGIGRARSLTLCPGEANDCGDVESRIRGAERDLSMTAAGSRERRQE